jgi:glycosyltransferase involved in cell wall biosynthesis
MPYAVDNEFFRSRASAARLNRGQLKRDLGLDPHRPVILFASKMEPRKRARKLLEAYIKLSRDGRTEPEPYLLLLGDGDERGSLERQAKQTGWSSIKFLGFKNQTELPRYYDLCDVFVLVSEYEPWGLVVNEVLNAGKPVIVGDQVGSAPDLVRDGENGFVIRNGDVSALADRLAILTRDSALADGMGQRGLARISRWNFEADAIGLITALQSVCGADVGVSTAKC